jgi:hypothetical protein
MSVHKFSWENNIICDMYKKDKKNVNRVGASKFTFFTRDTLLFFPENLCANINI